MDTLKHFMKSNPVGLRMNGKLLPLLCGVIVLMTTFLFWHQLSADDDETISDRTAIESEVIASHVSNGIDVHLRTLQRMSDRWEFAGRPSAGLWRRDANLNLNDFAGFQSIQWMDADYQVQWVVPTIGSRPSLELNHTEFPERRDAMIRAHELGQMTTTPLTDLVLGGQGFLAYQPVYIDGDPVGPGEPRTKKFDGFIVGTFVSSELFASAIDELALNGYSIEILSDGETAFVQGGDDQTYKEKWSAETPVSLAGRELLVRSWPQEEEVERQQSSLATVTLVGGLILSILIAALVRVAQVARQRTMEARAISSDLRRSTQALETSNHDLEQFAYVASHDLRAPLVSLRGMTDILVADFGDSLPDDARLYLDRIGVNATRMQNLLDDVLQVSRLRQTETEFTTVDLNRIIESVISQLSHDLQTRDASVKVLDTMPTIQGNPAWLGQIFVNLVDNAIQYTPADRTPRIEIGCRQRQDYWELFVSDNGMGIPEELRSRVFGMFQRLPGGKSTNPGGSGMGLAIVERGVEAHGGRVWIDSSSSAGTTFVLLFPRVEAVGDENLFDLHGAQVRDVA